MPLVGQVVANRVISLALNANLKNVQSFVSLCWALWGCYIRHQNNFTPVNASIHQKQRRSISSIVLSCYESKYLWYLFL